MAAADAYQRLVDLLLVDIEFLEYLHGIAAAFAGNGNKQMLHAHILVIEAVRLTDRRLQYLRHPGCRIYLHTTDSASG